ncbi:MAG: SusE domain-containing protein [Bacteroidales bacterium]|nr:SusE domain-containing protein [Bacteroidales bacterium]
MKKLNLIAIITAAMVLVSSCEDEVRDPIVTLNAAPEILAPTGGSFVLTEETEDDLLTTVEWSDADFGYMAAITYTLELDEAGNDFSEPIALATSQESLAPLYVGEINNLLLSAGYPFAVEGNFEMRVAAAVHKDVDTLFSQPVAMSITPFEKIIIYPKLWVPGDYMDPQWSPGDSPNLYSIKSNNKYEGYIWNPNATANFKFTSAPDWNSTNYGYGSGDEVSGVLSDDSGAGNLYLTSAGYYKMNADLTAMTYSFLKTEWGVIGDATPGEWTTDTNMTYDPATKVWSVTLDLVAGMIKFRANDGWDLNYGSNNANGIADPGGSDISVASAGNYTVVLDLNGPLYRYSITRN